VRRGGFDRGSTSPGLAATYGIRHHSRFRCAVLRRAHGGGPDVFLVTEFHGLREVVKP